MLGATFYVIMFPPPTKCHFWLSQSTYQIAARAKCVAARLRPDHVTCLYLSPGGKSHCVTAPCGSRLFKGKAKLYSLVFHLHKNWLCSLLSNVWIEYIIVSIATNDTGIWIVDANQGLINLRHLADALIQKCFEVSVNKYNINDTNNSF